MKSFTEPFQDLQIPFSWEERRPVLLEHCLYLPPHYQGEGHLGAAIWQDPSSFASCQPFAIEYCSGNGQWIVRAARAAPHLNWVAVEKDFSRARKIWRKRQKEQLSNLFVVCGEALEFSRLYLPSASVFEIWVNFPDPWPKRHHAKHRLIQAPFVDEVKRQLQTGGPITLVTDDFLYSKQISAQFSAWENAFAPQLCRTELPEYGTSYFHSLWLQKERTIRYHRYYPQEEPQKWTKTQLLKRS